MTKTQKPKKSEKPAAQEPDAAKRPKVSMEQMLLSLCAEAGVGRSISPMLVAKNFAEGRKGEGAKPSHWARDIRSAAIGLARTGKISIFRKGKAVDVEELKTLRGVYRIGLPRPEGAAELDDEADEA